ncbi:MAG TPA: hypothetical protein VKM55_23745 [Candidatus Lokiarchaeia archaeon]|nr:hypothetical protein [Candidatus Lokiarchaeia archaeon]
MGYWGQVVNADLLNASILLSVFLFGAVNDAIKKKQKRFPIILLIGIGVLFLSPFLRALSNILSDITLFQLNWIFEVVALMFVIIWSEQLLFEHPRAFVMLGFSFLGGISVSYSWIIGNVVIMADGSLDWFGAWQITGTLFLWAFYAFLFVFFVRTEAKAPWKIRIVVIIFFILAVFDTFFLPSMGDFIPIFAWYIIIPTLIVLSILVAAYIMLIHPELLSILTYTLDRLVVIDADKGVSLFTYTWEKSHVENSDLLVPLLQALQSMSFEVLSMGQMREIHMESGNLLFRKGEHVIVGIISSRSTMFLQTRLAAFTDLFEIQFRQSLENPMYDLTSFQPAKSLVEKIFQTIPLASFSFSMRRKPAERDYLSEDADAQLIQDLKDAFAADEEGL